MTLYADLLFLVNFIMNGFVLLIASKVLRQKRKARWLVLGGFVMALLYTLILVIEPLRFLNIALASVVILAAGVMVAFYPTGVRHFLRLMLAAYGITFVVGGLGMALFFLTDLPYAIYYIAADLDGFRRAVSWQLVLVGTVVSYIMIKLVMRLVEHQTIKRQMLMNVMVCLNEKYIFFDALVDTGHSLKDPLSQSPVIVAEFEQIQDFLPDGLKGMFYDRQETNIAGVITSQESPFYQRIRMIPFTSIGKSSGMLIGFRPDQVMVGAKNSRQDVVIGIYNDKLTPDGRYQALLSPDLLPVPAA
ncbi:MAG: sigma-E processing peptidase SpoIIGA [Defluviitaleaceae bacterium]|nr:sigma-E processing peptidase SpoIIGA [Defluviitaleaceae bacterium]